VQNEREWSALCREVLRLPELLDDPRFATNDDRVANNDELTSIIEGVFAELAAEQVLALFDRAGIANARLRSPAEFARHPQLAARARWRPIETPGGIVDALLPPVVADSWEPVMGGVPARGEHNDPLRAEFAAGGDRPA
jgi:crotonobetainyl-CoA:carnitine CoA-transferase CaiB-like acyl-CoA transferase